MIFMDREQALSKIEELILLVDDFDQKRKALDFIKSSYESHFISYVEFQEFCSRVLNK